MMSRITSTPRPLGVLQDHLHEVLCAVVDGTLGSKRFTCAAFLVRASRCKHQRTARRRELNRSRADAARTAVKERRLTLLQPTPLEHVGPDGEERLGNCSRRISGPSTPAPAGTEGAGATHIVA